MTDPIKATSEWLNTATSITDDVSDRIYGVILPEEYNADEDGLAIVVNLRGGPTHEEMPIIYPSMDITVYGPKLAFADCLRVYGNIFDLMEGQNNIGLTNGFILACQNEVIGQPLQEPGTGWAMVPSYWKLTMRAN